MSLQIEELTFALLAGIEKLHITSASFYAFLLEDSTGDILVSFDDSTWLTFHKAKAMSFPGASFTRLRLKSTTAQTVKIQFGEFNAESNQASVNATINTTISPSNTLANPADVTVPALATVIAAASANRKELIIHVPSDAANSIRIGSATVAAAAGIEVEPGTTFVLATESAVYAIRDGAADIDVSILDLTRP